MYSLTHLCKAVRVQRHPACGLLPLDAVAALGLLSANYARRGLRHSPQIALGLGRTSLATVGLGRAADDRRATFGVLREALDDALGHDWHARVERPVWPTEPDELRRSGVLRAARSRSKFTQLRDQHYGASHNEVLDLWRHPDLPSDAGAPMVLQIPGGAWVMGSKRGQGYPLMNHLAERGWICASMSYRLAPRHPWPAHVVDVKLAVAWLKAHAHEIGGDPDFLVVTGGSAGGHLAALTALSSNDPRFQPGFEDADTCVQASVPLYGRYDWLSREGEGRREFMHFLERVVVQDDADRHPEVFKVASPLHRVTSDAPPFFVLHGRNDTIIPVEQARAFVTALTSVSRNSVAYAELPGAQHAFDILLSRRAQDVCDAVSGFLGVVLGEHRARVAGAMQPRTGISENL